MKKLLMQSFDDLVFLSMHMQRALYLLKVEGSCGPRRVGRAA